MLECGPKALLAPSDSLVGHLYDSLERGALTCKGSARLLDVNGAAARRLLLHGLACLLAQVVALQAASKASARARTE